MDSSGHLLLRLPAEITDDISTLAIRGKVQTYALALISSPNTVVRGLSFFATTLFAWESASPTIESCRSGRVRDVK